MVLIGGSGYGFSKGIAFMYAGHLDLVSNQVLSWKQNPLEISHCKEWG